MAQAFALWASMRGVCVSRDACGFAADTGGEWLGGDGLGAACVRACGMGGVRAGACAVQQCVRTWKALAGIHGGVCGQACVGCVRRATRAGTGGKWLGWDGCSVRAVCVRRARVVRAGPCVCSV